MENLKNGDMLQALVDDIVATKEYEVMMPESYSDLMSRIPENMQKMFKTFLFHAPYLDFFKGASVFVTGDQSIMNMVDPEEVVYHLFQIVDNGTRVEFLVAEVAVLAHLFVTAMKIVHSDKYNADAKEKAQELIDESSVEVLSYHIKNLIELSKSDDEVSKNDENQDAESTNG
jgi:hypothetical protein